MIRWIFRLADLLSGRIENTLVSHNHRLRKQEKQVSKNQDTINSVAQELSGVSDEFDAGIQSLKDQITAGSAPEDLDFTALEAVADKLKSAADALTPAPAGTPSEGGDANPPSNSGSPDGGVVGGPIVHEDIPPTPLAGASGPTDAGAPIETQAPGQPNPDAPTTPVADNAAEEAGLPTADIPVVNDAPAPPTGDAGDANPSSTGDDVSSESSSAGTEVIDAETNPAGSSSPTLPTGTPASSDGDEFDD